MKLSRLSATLALSCLFVAIAQSAFGSLTLVAGPGLAHPGNLVANGSFENGHPAGPGAPNFRFWATGTTLTPFALPPGWTSSGQSGSYAMWGSDDLGPTFELRGSDTFPDGQLGMYFGNGGSSVSLAPTFNPDGSVSFSGAPSFAPTLGGPVVLSQTVNTQLAPSPSYSLSFWASGEFAGNLPSANEGIFGFRVTNVLAGDPINYLAVPAGLGPQGASRVYRYDFVPLNPLAPVTVEFYNFGHLDLSPFGGPSFTTELVIDDVVIQKVPEPSTLVLGAAGLLGLVAWRRTRNAKAAA